MVPALIVPPPRLPLYPLTWSAHTARNTYRSVFVRVRKDRGSLTDIDFELGSVRFAPRVLSAVAAALKEKPSSQGPVPIVLSRDWSCCCGIVSVFVRERACVYVCVKGDGP